MHRNIFRLTNISNSGKDNERVIIPEFILLALFIINTSLAFSQAPPVLVWEKKYGNSSEISKDIAIAPDGSILAVGVSNSNGGDVTGHHGSTDSSDAWVVKMDSAGNMLWQKSIGGSGIDFFNTVIATADSGFLCFGSSKSNDGDLQGNSNRYGVWVVKLSPGGNIAWSRSYGGSYNTTCYSAVLMEDGGIALIIEDESLNHAVLKLDASGNLLWQSQLNTLTGKYITETNDHTLLTSSGLVFDRVTGDTSRFAGFPPPVEGFLIQALQKINNKIYISVKQDGSGKAGYFDDVSDSFVYQVWSTDQYTEEYSYNYNLLHHGLAVWPDNTVITAGYYTTYTRGGVFQYPMFYSGTNRVVNGNVEYGEYNSVKLFPSGNEFLCSGWFWYENKFWFRKYGIPKITANWTGAINTAWENPGNWSTNAVPGRSTKAIIPANRPRYPIVNSNAVCFSLQVDSSASVKVNTGFDLNITGK